MAFENVIQQNFASGELSPKVKGRSDLKLVKNGLQRMLNFIAETQGPARFRTGTRFVNHTRLNKIAFLIPFQFNDEQSYLLEFTDLFMRIHKDEGAIVDDADNIDGASQASPVVVLSNTHSYSNGDEVFISGVSGMTELNNKFFLVANVNGGVSYELTDIDGDNIDGTGFTAYASGGTAEQVVEVATPWTEAQLRQMKFTQNADTMYVAHPSHVPYKITRSSHIAWSVATFSRTTDPFGASGSDDVPGAIAFYEGRLFYGRSNNNPERFWGSRAPTTAGAPRYDDFTTGSNADDAVIFTIAPTTGKVDLINWLAGSVNFLTAGTFGGVSKITGSGTDEPITPASIDVKPVESVGCADINPIPQGNLLIYVQQGKLVIRSFEFDILADSHKAIDRNLVSDHITVGGILQIAFQTGRPDILWSVRGDGVLLGLTFKSKEDVSGWHRHTLGGTDTKVLSVGIIPQPAAFDQVWLVVERTINGLTRRSIEFFEDEPEIPDFEDFFTGNANKAADTIIFENEMFEKQKQYVHVDSALSYDGLDPGIDAGAAVTPAAVTGTGINFSADAAVFSASDVGREIWKKTSSGVGAGRAEITAFISTTSVTCTIKKDFNNTDAMASGAWYLTAGSLSGLDHLEGETVKVVTDGGVHDDEVVTNGTITLDFQASKIHVGLGFKGLLKTLNIEAGGVTGPAQTKPRNIEKVGVQFLNTLGAKFGTDRYKLSPIGFRSTAHSTNRPSPLFSGIKDAKFRDGWTTEKILYVEQVSPLPCVVQFLDIYVDATNE